MRRKEQRNGLAPDNIGIHVIVGGGRIPRFEASKVLRWCIVISGSHLCVVVVDLLVH